MGKWEPFVQGAWTYQASSTVQLRVDQSAVVGAMPAYGLADFRLGGVYDKTTAELYLTNAFDKRAQLSRFTQTAPTFFNGSPTPVDTQAYIVPAVPRTIGIRISQKF